MTEDLIKILREHHEALVRSGTNLSGGNRKEPDLKSITFHDGKCYDQLPKTEREYVDLILEVNKASAAFRSYGGEENIGKFRKAQKALKDYLSSEFVKKYISRAKKRYLSYTRKELDDALKVRLNDGSKKAAQRLYVKYVQYINDSLK